MDIKIRRTEEFVPKWNKNDKDKNPIVFKLKYLTVSEHEDCRSLTPIKLDINGKKVSGGELIADPKKIFSYSVMEITNLTTIDEDDKKVDIRSAEDMLTCQSQELVGLFFEVTSHILAMSKKVNSKN